MIFICGYHNTGKTTIAKKLISFGFFHIETGDLVRNLYKDNNSKINFYDWTAAITKNNIHYFDKHIINNILKSQQKIKKDVIITGNRQLSGIKYIISKTHHNPHFKNIIIYLKAPCKELYKRQLGRTDKIIKNLNKDKFINDYLGFDKSMGIDKIELSADYIINSDNSKELVIQQIIEILRLNNYKL